MGVSFVCLFFAPLPPLEKQKADEAGSAVCWVWPALISTCQGLGDLGWKDLRMGRVCHWRVGIRKAEETGAAGCVLKADGDLPRTDLLPVLPPMQRQSGLPPLTHSESAYSPLLLPGHGGVPFLNEAAPF